MTRIFFTANGKPFWREVDTDKFIHNLAELESRTVPPVRAFTEFEKEWFKRPITRTFTL